MKGHSLKTSVVNLIADMVAGGATDEELDRVIAYSVSVIDLYKAYIANDIGDLENRYAMTKPKGVETT